MVIIQVLLLQFSCSEYVSPRPIPDKTVVLTFDDAAKTHITLVAPLLRKYKFGATFFVCEFPPDFEDTTKYMTWPQIKQLSTLGFEIGNHTHHHKHVNKISRDSLISELLYINNKCKSLGIPQPVSFAYPGSDTDPSTAEILTGQGFLVARAGERKAYDLKKDHPLYIPSVGTNGNDREKFYKAVSQAKNGKVVVFTVHGVPDYAHQWVTTPPVLFEEYLKYLHDQKYNVIALKDLLPYINMKEALKIPVPLKMKK